MGTLLAACIIIIVVANTDEKHGFGLIAVVLADLEREDVAALLRGITDVRREMCMRNKVEITAITVPIRADI